MNQFHRNIQLIIGGARSGKSDCAEAIAIAEAAGLGVTPYYIATTICSQTGTDEETKRRVDEHRRRRGDRFELVDNAQKISDEIELIERRHTAAVILVDCMTLWLSGLDMAIDGRDIIDADEVLNSLVAETTSRCNSHVILVTNELGWGMVPMAAQVREFRDRHGRMNQKLSAAASGVTMVVAGIAVKIK